MQALGTCARLDRCPIALSFPQETVRFAVLSMRQSLPWSTDSLDGEVRSPLRRDSVLEGEGAQVP